MTEEKKIEMNINGITVRVRGDQHSVQLLIYNDSHGRNIYLGLNKREAIQLMLHMAEVLKTDQSKIRIVEEHTTEEEEE